MAKLADYKGRLADIPFDFHELVGALAPRPVFISAPLKDSNFKWESVDRVVKAAREVYALYGVPQNLTVDHPDCEHDFHPGDAGEGVCAVRADAAVSVAQRLQDFVARQQRSKVSSAE